MHICILILNRKAEFLAGPRDLYLAEGEGLKALAMAGGEIRLPFAGGMFLPSHQTFSVAAAEGPLPMAVSYCWFHAEKRRSSSSVANQMTHQGTSTSAFCGRAFSVVLTALVWKIRRNHNPKMSELPFQNRCAW